MAERLSIERSAQRALQGYLQRECDSELGASEVEVNESWPAAESALPRKAVSILLAGPPEYLRLDGEQESVRMVPDAQDATKGLYTYRVQACRQPLQLEIWAQHDAWRDEIRDVVERALQKGEAHTLGTLNGSPTRDGPLLALDDTFGHAGFASFCFDGFDTVDTSDAVRVNEFRARARGHVDVELTVKAKSPRLAQLNIVSNINSHSYSGANL